jgi:hypothetical protein
MTGKDSCNDSITAQTISKNSNHNSPHLAADRTGLTLHERWVVQAYAEDLRRDKGVRAEDLRREQQRQSEHRTGVRAWSDTGRNSGIEAKKLAASGRKNLRRPLNCTPCGDQEKTSEWETCRD